MADPASVPSPHQHDRPVGRHPADARPSDGHHPLPSPSHRHHQSQQPMPSTTPMKRSYNEHSMKDREAEAGSILIAMASLSGPSIARPVQARQSPTPQKLTSSEMMRGRSMSIQSLLGKGDDTPPSSTPSAQHGNKNETIEPLSDPSYAPRQPIPRMQPVQLQQNAIAQGLTGPSTPRYTAERARETPNYYHHAAGGDARMMAGHTKEVYGTSPVGPHSPAHPAPSDYPPYRVDSEQTHGQEASRSKTQPSWWGQPNHPAHESRAPPVQPTASSSTSQGHDDSQQYLSMQRHPNLKKNALHAYVAYTTYTDLVRRRPSLSKSKTDGSIHNARHHKPGPLVFEGQRRHASLGSEPSPVRPTQPFAPSPKSYPPNPDAESWRAPHPSQHPQPPQQHLSPYPSPYPSQYPPSTPTLPSLPTHSNHSLPPAQSVPSALRYPTTSSAPARSSYPASSSSSQHRIVHEPPPPPLPPSSSSTSSGRQLDERILHKPLTAFLKEGWPDSQDRELPAASSASTTASVPLAIPLAPPTTRPGPFKPIAMTGNLARKP